MLKILQARLQQYMNRELPDVQAGLIKYTFLSFSAPINSCIRTKRNYIIVTFWYISFVLETKQLESV